MKMASGVLALGLVTVISLPEAQARPRLGPALLLAPLAIVGGIAGAAVGSRKARAHRAYQHRIRRERAAARRAAKRAIVAAAARADTVVAAGWSGPLFWPHAYHDIFGYAIGANAGGEVWNRGFGDALTGLFQGDGTFRRTGLSERGMEPAWDNLCAGDSPKSAHAAIAKIREKVKPTPAQQTSLDALSDALTRAAERIEAACPARRPASATGRLHMMIARLTAMRQAVLTVQAPLRNFYEQLDDAQKAAFDNAGDDAAEDAEAPKPAKAATGADCAEPAALPQRQIERALQPTPAQRAELERFDRTAKGLDRFVATTCPDREAPPSTAPERLDAVKDRLAVLRYAVTSLSPAYERLERSLSERQKSRLGALDRPAETAR